MEIEDLENEEIKTEEPDENEALQRMKNPTKRGRKRVYLEDDAETLDVTFRITKKQYETLKEKAKEKGISMASYMRESLIKSFPSDVSDETKQNIDQLLEDCSQTDEWEDEPKFEIEGEQGFLNQVVQRELTAEFWTPRQLDRVAERFVVGYKGYFVKPDVNSLLKRFGKAMKFDKTQREYLERKVIEVLEESGIELPSEEDEW